MSGHTHVMGAFGELWLVVVDQANLFGDFRDELQADLASASG
jgi:hypothetical protein